MEAKPASDPSATSGRPCYDWGPYHDEVWGTPLRTSRELFAQLSLASQQAGLSWRVVWSKREGYAAAFRGWDFRAIASMTATDVDELCGPAWAGRVLQSRRKLEAIVHNAGVCVEIEDSYPGGLARMIRAGFLRSFFEGDPDATNRHVDFSAIEYSELYGPTSRFSAAMERKMVRSKHKSAAWDFKFLGSITLQAFALQVGLLNGHSPACWKNPRCEPCAPDSPAPRPGASGAAAGAQPAGSRKCGSAGTAARNAAPAAAMAEVLDAPTAGVQGEVHEAGSKRGRDDAKEECSREPTTQATCSKKRRAFGSVWP